MNWTDVWKSVFNRDLRSLDDTLQQYQGTANTSKTPTEVTKPKWTLVWILFQQMQGSYTKLCFTLAQCARVSPHRALVSKLENVSGEGKRGNSMFSFAADGNYCSLPWRNLQQRLGCTEISGKSHRILWAGASHLVFFFMAINLSDFVTPWIKLMTALLLPPNWEALFMGWWYISCNHLLCILYAIFRFSFLLVFFFPLERNPSCALCFSHVAYTYIFQMSVPRYRWWF